MRISLLSLALIGSLALSGCARFDSFGNAQGPGDALATQNPAQATAAALSATDVLAFIDPAAGKLLSDKEKSEAASAQFYALQFGRPGAPRYWTGDSGASGTVTVGPYVRVNNLDCRDFTHTVTVKGSDYLRKGTACREMDGQWGVVDVSAG